MHVSVLFACSVLLMVVLNTCREQSLQEDKRSLESANQLLVEENSAMLEQVAECEDQAARTEHLNTYLRNQVLYCQRQLLEEATRHD